MGPPVRTAHALVFCDLTVMRWWNRKARPARPMADMDSLASLAKRLFRWRRERAVAPNMNKITRGSAWQERHV